MLLEGRDINLVIRDKLKNSMEQLKCKILGPITPEEIHVVEKIHHNLFQKSCDLTKRDIQGNLMN